MLAELSKPDAHGPRKAADVARVAEVWDHLQRQGITVARCTVKWLMRVNGSAGSGAAKSAGPRSVTR